MKFTTLLILIKLYYYIKPVLYKTGITFIFFRAGLPLTPPLALAGCYWYGGVVKNRNFLQHPRERVFAEENMNFPNKSRFIY